MKEYTLLSVEHQEQGRELGTVLWVVGWWSQRRDDLAVLFFYRLEKILLWIKWWKPSSWDCAGNRKDVQDDDILEEAVREFYLEVWNRLYYEEVKEAFCWAVVVEKDWRTMARASLKLCFILFFSIELTVWAREWVGKDQVISLNRVWTMRRRHW